MEEETQPQDLGPPYAGTETAELEALRSEIEDANRKGQEYLQLLQRVQADFVNYRRRMEQEREDQIRSAKARVLFRFLPVLDDLDRAQDAVPADQRNSNWAQGIDMIRRKLWQALEVEGITTIDPVGKQFNPWEEEAVIYEERTSEPEGKVLGVLRPGYKLDGQVIRPAQVIVAK